MAARMGRAATRARGITMMQMGSVPHKPLSPRRFSMLRSYALPDLFTVGNAASGTAAIFLCLKFLSRGRAAALWVAFMLLPLAIVFDALDGWVARKRGIASAIGADMDSLADIVSFGVAPAVLGYTLGLRGLWDVVCLTWFVCCGISRLARFNVTSASLMNVTTGKVRYFEGTPIPTSVILVLLLAVLYRLGMIGQSFWWGRWELAGR